VNADQASARRERPDETDGYRSGRPWRADSVIRPRGLVWIRDIPIDPIAVRLPGVAQDFRNPITARLTRLIGGLFLLVVLGQIRRP
jgi:hypothetical protein